MEPISGWGIVLDSLRITVHQWHGLDGLFVSAPNVGIDRWQLNSKTLDEAKIEALEIVRNELNNMLTDVKKELRQAMKKAGA